MIVYKEMSESRCSLGVTSVLAFTMGLLISSLVLAVSSLSWVTLADVTSTCKKRETHCNIHAHTHTHKHTHTHTHGSDCDNLATAVDADERVPQ